MTSLMGMTGGTIVGLVALAIWLYLVLARGGYWLARERDDKDVPADPVRWPSVTAVVPARNEADVIGQSIGSLLRQDYPGTFRVILVDDDSDDGTAATARRVAATLGTGRPLEIVNGAALPPGWTGKLWALQQGVQQALVSDDLPDYLLLTDADIGHSSDNLRALVARAEHGDRALVSLMAELSCVTRAEAFLIPAFVFFFQMLYPFSWVARADLKLAAGAGGCMLVRREALEKAGGLASVRAEIIDDCALARRLKEQGPIWLGLTHRARSLRPYISLRQIGRMISRSAYAQLGYSPLLLAGTVAGMALTYLAPPVLALFGDGLAQGAGAGAWLLMAMSFLPMLRFYRRSPLWGVALPAIAAAYTVFTVQSAVAVWRGRGGMWKGRAQAITGDS
ncbi:hopene-associated glycosyltransferase HpnB [Enhydrobacter aerosaccus]|uniref:Hopene-associated glycosyltransferase HpnB n=1 Tax=Enhydrobacter aerosaccus TaxID=225324 RepID=A0A1T4NUU5_9HYPH|nr:glycosyltransferase [Enhydrobacter aerosaccus]SJZ82832.1 hopene-associated glycosyltransferase HpnB [Enhydrobacter aerosaccus]